MGRHRGRGSLAIRLLGYARFLFGAWLESRQQPSPDVVVTFHNPPLVGLLGAHVARRFDVPFVYIVQDIHPDILVRTGSPKLPRWLIATWRRLSQLTFDSSQLVITLSDAMKDYLVTTYALRAERVVAIPLWAQPSLEHLSSGADAVKRARAALRPAVKFNDDLVVLYAGNMGVMHPVEILVLAAAKLRSRPISFLFVGDGTKRRDLEQLAHRMSVESVQFLPFQPVREFELLVQASDICTVALQPGLEDLCLPSRTPTFMSAGRPILAVMRDRAPQSRELNEVGAGWCAVSVEGVVDLLERLLDAPDLLRVAGSSARSLYRERYRRETLVHKYVEAVAGVSSHRINTPNPPRPQS
jgi:glycosyltransferase involved in cell wall biosynthesis